MSKACDIHTMCSHAEFVHARCPDGRTIAKDMLAMCAELVAARATADEAAKTGVKYLQLYESATAGWAQANKELAAARRERDNALCRLEELASMIVCPKCGYKPEAA